MGFKKLHERCEICKYKDACYHEQLSAYATQEITNDLAAPTIIKHDYRNIKVGVDTTITIDLEEIKKELNKIILFEFGA